MTPPDRLLTYLVWSCETQKNQSAAPRIAYPFQVTRLTAKPCRHWNDALPRVRITAVSVSALYCASIQVASRKTSRSALLARSKLRSSIVFFNGSWHFHTYNRNTDERARASRALSECPAALTKICECPKVVVKKVDIRNEPCCVVVPNRSAEPNTK